MADETQMTMNRVIHAAVRRDFERTASTLLPAYVCKVRDRRLVECILDERLELGRIDLAAKVGDDLR